MSRSAIFVRSNSLRRACVLLSSLCQRAREKLYESLCAGGTPSTLLPPGDLVKLLLLKAAAECRVQSAERRAEEGAALQLGRLLQDFSLGVKVQSTVLSAITKLVPVSLRGSPWLTKTEKAERSEMFPKSVVKWPICQNSSALENLLSDTPRSSRPTHPKLFD